MRLRFFEHRDHKPVEVGSFDVMRIHVWPRTPESDDGDGYVDGGGRSVSYTLRLTAEEKFWDLEKGEFFTVEEE